jgi:hypothetical protein
MEDVREDQHLNPTESSQPTANIIRQAINKQCDVVNLYLMDEESARRMCLPFLQNTSFAGLQGEIVRVKALFDEGAMISAMCSATFDKVKHRLGNWAPSSKSLCMANGTIVPSQAKWKGKVMVRGIRTQGEFEVFDSGGGWSFLFGKPMLQAFKAIHDYETDQVQVSGIGGTKILYNHRKWQAAVEEIEEQKEGRQSPSNVAPANLLQDDNTIFTRISDPFNPKWVAHIVKSVQYGNTLTTDERQQAEALVTQYVDIFTGSLAEVIPVPGAMRHLNIQMEQNSDCESTSEH